MRGTKTEISPGVWRLRVYAGRRPNGSPIQVSKTVKAPEPRRPGAGVRLADTELARLIDAVERDGVRSDNPTVSSLLDQWIDFRAPALSPTTEREHRRTIEKVLKPAVGNVRLDKLTSRHLDRMYADLTARGLKPAAVRRVHAVIHAALHQARKWKMVRTNHAADASPPAVHRSQVEAPTPEQVRAVVKAAEGQEPAMAALLLLAALTGARRGELCALRWSDVDFDSGLLTISRSVYETKGGGWGEKETKTHQRRSVSLDQLGVEALRRYRRSVEKLASDLELRLDDHGFMFSQSPVGSEPLRPDFVSKATTKAAEAAGVATHLHALRHFSATQLVGCGTDVRTVAARLGHEDPSVTLRIYSHALPERDREAAAVLGRTLLPELPG